MKRIYVAGCYSADNVITVLDNMREGMRLSTEVLLLGLTPFCPWLDHHFQFMLRDGESLTVEDYYRYSMDWLEVSDAMLLVPEWSFSRGTLKEIEMARCVGIPVFQTMDELKRAAGVK